MAISPPEERIWWKQPIGRAEVIWIAVAFVWGLVMFSAMVYWHIVGEQNLSNEAYHVIPDEYAAKAEALAEQYKVREDETSGYPIVHPPPGSDIYLIARLWEWWPIFELEKGQNYRLHMSSLDYQHGFSLQPENINIQVHPNYDMVLTVTPSEAGEYSIVCNEYCGIGHHIMVGKMIVVE